MYLLFLGDDCIYVGRAGKGDGTIGARISAHLKSEDKKWDSFAWFGFRKVGEDGQLEAITHVANSHTDEIRDMEAVLIYLLGPKYNLRAGDHRHLVHYEQLEADPA